MYLLCTEHFRSQSLIRSSREPNCTVRPGSREGCLPQASGGASRPPGRRWVRGLSAAVVGQLLGGDKGAGLSSWRPGEYPASGRCWCFPWSYLVALNISSLCTHFPFGLLSTLIRQAPGAEQPESDSPACQIPISGIKRDFRL